MKSYLILFGAITALFSCSFASEYHQCGWEICASKGAHLLGLREQWHLLQSKAPPGNGRQYARDRKVDVAHQLIDFTPDFENQTLSGVATITFSPIAKELDEFSLDAVDLNVTEVNCAEAEIQDWNVTKDSIDITFAQSIPAGKEVSVSVTYSAEPRHGLYFRTEKMGYPKGDDHLWTQGEPEMHRHWFPGYDYPNERFTTEVICRVPEGMTVLSNGELISNETKNGVTTVHWHQKKEHVNYLISVVAGYMERLEDQYGDLELAFYTPPSYFNEAENSFRDTSRILEFLEKELAVPFPWAKYYNICVSDFMWGGMENTSVTTLTTRTLFSKDSENLRSSHRLDAHEITHQWFGDLLTCKDWSQLWLNEGFATYYTHLYDLEKFGKDDFLYGLLRDADGILKNQDEKPIVWRKYSNPKEQFDYRAYPKGSWVLHMLRCKLGEDLYRECITTYLKENENRTVVTADLMEVLEEKTGRSFDEFFDQWVFHGGEPVLDVNYSWNDKEKKARIQVKQSQKVSDSVLLFDFELPFHFIDEEGNAYSRSGRVREGEQDFAFHLPKKPAIVRINPELSILAEIKFRPSDPMLEAQLANESDALGRILAVRVIAGKKDKKNLNRLEKVLENDPFYGVRVEAARALGKVYSEGAFEVLRDNRNQNDARVRKEVVEALAKFTSEASLEVMKAVIAEDKNPEIVSTALRQIGKYSPDTVADILLGALDRDSYSHRIAASAITAMRKQSDPRYLRAIREHIQAKEEAFSTWALGDALDTLAYLAKEEQLEDKRKTREFIANYLQSPKAMLRPKVIAAMGTLEDPQAIPLIEPFVHSGNSNDNGESKAAEAAIAKINANKKQSDEVKDLRKQMMELEKKLKQISETLEKENGEK